MVKVGGADLGHARRRAGPAICSLGLSSGQALALRIWSPSDRGSQEGIVGGMGGATQ